jgi:cysteinyl-tRNA synthetase
MALKLYDTLTREKREFVPLDANNVRMYVCGPTVYDFAHIGNARPVIVFDVLFRLLRHLYGAEHVTYVRNITDVDDKINARAAERSIDIRQLTDETYANFKADVAALGCLPPTVEPRATEYVSKPDAPVDMIRLIARLIANGNAYAAEGHVLFSVVSMPDYGRLARRSLDEMMAGARVEVAPYKRDAMDFVLWKPSPSDLPGWDSPWGRGRPGWHIECSAMSAALLGETFDIHGGGIDLVFPHHENEIAQSRCAFHTPVMANTWMHNGFLQVEGEKMAKSAGNFVTIRELLQTKHFGGRRWAGETLRLAMLKTHYRQPIDWTVSALDEAEKTLDRWYHLMGDGPPPVGEIDVETVDALSDDLNTPQAIKRLRAIYYSSRGPAHPSDQHESRAVLASSARLLGLMQHSKEDWFLQERSDRSALSISHKEINQLVAMRSTARKAKDFAESDRIRDELAAMGVVLKDSKDGTTWEIAR